MLSSSYRSAIDSRLPAFPKNTTDTAREGIANAIEAANTAGPHAQAFIRAARQSFAGGWQQAMWAGVAVMAVLFLFILAHRAHPAR